jgi:ketosteroid isomerase-like protein
MSQKNVELVQQAADAFNRRDLDAFLALADPGIEFTPYTVAMEGGYQGHDGIRRWWQDLFAVFPDWRVEVEVEVRDLGELTLATMHARGHGGESGTPIDQMLWQLAEWSVDGKLVRARHYANEADAIEAAGLRE